MVIVKQKSTCIQTFKDPFWVEDEVTVKSVLCKILHSMFWIYIL